MRILYTQHTQYADGRSDSGPWLRFLKLRGGWTHEPGLQGSWGWQIAAPLAPQQDELVVQKHRNSGFVGTNMDLLLRTAGIQSLVLTGVAINGCVESTARDAMYYDYYTIIPRDGVAGFDPEIQAMQLRLMAARFDVTSTQEVGEVWRQA